MTETHFPCPWGCPSQGQNDTDWYNTVQMGLTLFSVEKPSFQSMIGGSPEGIMSGLL